MASSFSWLDYSAQDRERVLNVIKQLNEPESRDEMGIGTIRDRISDLLFPGTSTIHTRLRYFLFVPWIYQKLEKTNKVGADAEKYIRELEEALIRALLKGDDTEGVIGRRASTKVKRMPSSVYWNGLYVWGIRKFNESQSEYYSRLKYYRQQKTTNDIDEAMSDTNLSYWTELPDMPKHFPSTPDLTMQLTVEESGFLISQITNALLTRDSLLAYLVRKNYSLSDEESLSFAWNLPENILQNLPSQLKNILITAQNFSETIQGARYLYNLMLAQKRSSDDLIESYQQQMIEWVDQIGQRWSDLYVWINNRDQSLWEIVSTVDIPRTKHFVDTWLDLMVEHNSNLYEISTSKKARQLISERERVLKKGKARLHNRAALELWNGASGAAYLDFRWSSAKSYLTEIQQAKGISNANTG